MWGRGGGVTAAQATRGWVHASLEWDVEALFGYDASAWGWPAPHREDCDTTAPPAAARGDAHGETLVSEDAVEAASAMAHVAAASVIHAQETQPGSRRRRRRLGAGVT